MDIYNPFALPLSTVLINRETGEFSFNRMEDVAEKMRLVDMEELRAYLLGLEVSDRAEFWQKIKLGSILSVAAFDMVSKQVDFEYDKLETGLPYNFETLAKVMDFRIMVGLHYLVKMAQELDIKSNLEPVLSFPLGSNVVTLLEGTRLYETLVTGKVITYGEMDEEENNDSLAILDRIESAEGEVLFRPWSRHKKVIDDKSRLAIGHILENTVKFGTGRRAEREVRLTTDELEKTEKIIDLDLKIPLLGKTGTANRYTNASFFGYLPGIADDGESLTVEDGYTIGVYVGFDNNIAMRRKNSRITGAAGALPTWNAVVNVLLKEKGYASRLDPVDLSFYGLVLKRDDLGQLNVAVDKDQGGKVDETLKFVPELSRYQPSIMTFGEKTDTGQFKPLSYFKPFWKASTEVH